MRFSKPTTSDGVLLIAALLLAPAWPSLAQNPGPGVNLLTNASFEDQQHGGVTGWVSRMERPIRRPDGPSSRPAEPAAIASRSVRRRTRRRLDGHGRRQAEHCTTGSPDGSRPAVFEGRWAAC